MLTVKRMGFAPVAAALKDEFRRTPAFLRGNWQGVSLKDKPEMAVHELAHVAIEVDLRGDGELDNYRRALQPNLPWADNHFEERVCGMPINPGVEWANWPWGQNAAKFLDLAPGPDVPSQDWAYLAGMLDGDGTIYFRDKERWQGVVRVYQRDRSICDQMLELFKVGKVASNGEDSETELPNGRVVDNSMFYWQVNAHEECKWLLSGLLPFLRIKKEKAEQALALINESKPLGNYKRKQVWGRDWEPRFNHNYMSRYWPRGDNNSPYLGMYGNKYGDLNDVVEKLVHTPTTRQAILPIYFPEDTAIIEGRQPCSMYYHFIMDQANRLDVVYPMRSCDFVRHWADDCYMTIRLLLWVIDQVMERTRLPIRPGKFVMHIANLHMFRNDHLKLFGGL